VAAGAEATVTAGPSRPRSTRRLTVWAAGISPDTWAMLAIAAAVVVAHLLYLLGFFDPNPLGPRSGLMSSVTPGPLGGQPTIDPNNGFISQAESHKAALDVIHLQAPWWNPYEGTGTPLAGEMQSAAFFPPTLLTLVANGQLYEHMLLELVAGIATYLLLRRLSLNRWAAWAAGVAFALNGTFAWFSHATVNPLAFLPLLLLGIELAYSAAADRRRGGWWLIAVALALSFYAGFPEVAYIDALLAAFWLVWRCGSVARDRLRALLGKALAGAACGALLTAPLAIATIDYVSHGDLGLHRSGTFGATHLPAQILPQLLLPYAFGPIFDFAGHGFELSRLWGSVGGYLNTSVLLFALLGLFASGRRGLRIALAVWIVLVFAQIYGEPPLLGHILGVLPGMSRVAFFRYATASLEFSVIVLAALGIDDLARAPAESRRRLLTAALAALVLVAAAAIGAQSLIGRLEPRFGHRPYFEVSLAWGVIVVLAAVAIVLLRSAQARIRLLASLLAVDACALFVVPELSAPRSVTVDTAPVRYLRRHLGSSRFFTLGPVQPNYGSYFGVASLNINDLPIPSVFERYVRARLDQVVDPTVFVGNYGGGRSFLNPSPQLELERNLAGYRASGVSYVLTPAGQALPQSAATFTLVFRSPSTWIYALAGSEPYLTLADRSCRIAPRGRSSAHIACPTATTLVRRETDLPGWTATLDGHPVAIRGADGVFQAISVPAGPHEVRFSYAPPYIVWGLTGLVLGCGWLVLGATAGRLRPGAAAARASRGP
jgi:Bacterial membrane protein YfhO